MVTDCISVVSLVGKIILIMKTSLGMRREIPVIKASRVLTGPEVVGSRPVLVTFETFRWGLTAPMDGFKGPVIFISKQLARNVYYLFIALLCLTKYSWFHTTQHAEQIIDEVSQN